MQRISRRPDPDFISILVLLAFGLTAYACSFLASFHFDDFDSIVRNDALLDLTALGAIYSYCKERFLTYFTLAINYRIGGFDTTSYHIFNFFIHYFAAIFLYFLFIETWKTPAMKGSELNFPVRLGAFLSAGIFFLHPLQTESVTYIVQRAESLAGMFYLGSMLFYVKARLDNLPRAKWAYYVMVVLFGVSGAFSKETAVTLPAMIVAYEMLFFNTSIRELLRRRVILVLLVPAGIVVAYKIGSLISRNFYYDPGTYLTRKQYFLTQFSVLLTYLRLYFWPVGQNLDWDYPVAVTFFHVRTVTSLLFLVMLVLLAVLAWRKYRFITLGIIGFFITLAPTSSIIPIKDLIYEHRMYLAVGFLSMASSYLLLHGYGKIKNSSYRFGQITIALVIVTLLPLLTFLTYSRNTVWATEISLWHDAVQKSPNKARAHINYGRALHAAWEDIKTVKKEFEIARRLCPECPTPYHNLAFVYREEGDYEKAVALYLEAIQRDPEHQDALYQLARLYKELKQWDNARFYLERLMEMSPSSRYLQAYIDLLEVYLHLGLNDEATRLAKMMTMLPDGMPRVNYYRGMAFYTLKDYESAKVYFASQKNGNDKRIQSQLILGQIHYLDEEYQQAEEEFREVLEESPWSLEAHYNLAVLLEKSNRIQKAVEHFERARSIDPFLPGPSLHLIKLYGKIGLLEGRTNLMGKLLGLRPDSKEFSFLQTNQEEDFHETLHLYSARFLSDDSSPGSVGTRAIIATLREDYPEAIRLYEKHLENLTDQKEIQRVKKEVLRLEEVMQGKEPLVTPV